MQRPEPPMQGPIASRLRSRTGRLAMAAVGVGVIVVLLRHLGVAQVWAAVRTAAWTLPLVMLADLLYFGFEVVGLRALYGPDRHRLPTRELIRGSLIGHTVSALMPMPKPVAEGVKATLFGRWTSMARAFAAMTRFQGVVLFVNALFCIPLGTAAIVVSGFSLLTLAIAINAVVTLTIGAGILLLGRRSRIGEALARHVDHARHFGPEFDRLLQRETALPIEAMAWCFLGRTCQSGGYVVLLYAVSGSVSVTRALTALGIGFVGAMLGEILPNALGAAEGGFAYFAPLLLLPRTKALAIPLITHFSVLAWAIVGALVPVFWPPLALDDPRAATSRAPRRDELPGAP